MSDSDGGFYWLHEACERFGPEDMVAQAKAEEVANRQSVEMPEIPENPADRFRMAMEMISRVLPKTPALWDLQEVVAGMLYSGALEARGIQVAPKPGSEPEAVPRHLFSDSNKIGWVNSRIKRSGWLFEEIEVRVPPRANLQASRAAAPKPGSNGRPTKDPEINAIIDELLEGGVELQAMNRKVAFGHVLTKATERGLNTHIGYSAPVLQKIFARRFGHRK